MSSGISGELACDVPLIISNHPDNQAIADFYKVPYAVVKVTKENKAQAEARIPSLIDEHTPDFIVLARYMQILSNDFVNRYPQRLINIHHSFTGFCGRTPLSSGLRARSEAYRGHESLRHLGA